MRETTLHERHVQLGARMTAFAGWHMPLQYGPILEEVAAVRSRAGLFDLGHMGRLWIRGRDAIGFLDRVATNHCARIPPGSIRYSLLCHEDGGVIDDVLLYREEEGMYAVVNAANTDRVLGWLAEHTGESDVGIEDDTKATAMLALQGPRSEQILSRVTSGCDLAGLGYYKFTRATVCGLEGVRVSRTGYTGEDGFEVYLPAAEGPRAWREITAAGEGAGLVPVGLGARDVLRLEAGMPLYGHEIDEHKNPIEAGLSFAVSFREEKGDWIGRDALLRIREHPRRRLVGIVADGPRVPRQGQRLVRGGEELGLVCSGAPSPTLGAPIATAYLPVGLARAGERFEIDFRGRPQPCTVVELPFYSRRRQTGGAAAG